MLPYCHSQTLTTLDLQPDIIDRATTKKLPAKSSMFEVSEPVGMEGMAKFQNRGSERLNDGPLVRRPPTPLDEACQAGNMLWMALDTDQSRSPLHLTAHLVGCFASHGGTHQLLPTIPSSEQPTLG